MEEKVRRVRIIGEFILETRMSPETTAVAFGNWLVNLSGNTADSHGTTMEIISAKRIGVDEVKVNPAVIEALTKLTEGLEELKYAEGGGVTW